MKQPDGSPAYWKGMVQWVIAETQKGEADPSELMQMFYVAAVRLSEWEIYLGQKVKRRQRNKSAKMARKRNRSR